MKIISGLLFLILKPLDIKTQLKHSGNDLWFIFIILNLVEFVFKIQLNHNGNKALNYAKTSELYSPSRPGKTANPNFCQYHFDTNNEKFSCCWENH